MYILMALKFALCFCARENHDQNLRVPVGWKSARREKKLSIMNLLLFSATMLEVSSELFLIKYIPIG